MNTNYFRDRKSFLNRKNPPEVQKQFSSILFENRELEQTHNPYDQELREFGSIENGDLEQLKKSWEENYSGKIGTLARDELRNGKNLGIVVITLASRAAIRGGLHPETAFSLSDSYILRLEELTDTASVSALIAQAEIQFAEMVREIRSGLELPKKRPNPKVEQCKDYIFSHLHGKLFLKDIAAALHVNANYLSELFRKNEGISIPEFIRREKIRMAQNMLLYSPYSYIEIAAYLGFSSQSHMGAQFKKATGFTPREFREQYGVKEP